VMLPTKPIAGSCTCAGRIHEHRLVTAAQNVHRIASGTVCLTSACSTPAVMGRAATPYSVSLCTNWRLASRNTLRATPMAASRGGARKSSASQTAITLSVLHRRR
jgi:hypothetical protein